MTDTVPCPIDLTVIVNVFNGAPTLRRALNSIVNQSLVPKRIIAWDNQSTDETARICSEFPTVDYFCSPTHTTLGHARELARTHVTSSWLAYLDADDYWYPNKLEEQSRFLHHSVGLVYSSVEERTASDRLLRTIRPSSPTGFQVDSLLVHWDISLVTALINNDLLKKYAIHFDPKITASEEQDLIMQLASVSPFVSIFSVHGVITVSGNSLTNRSLRVLGLERRATLEKLQLATPYSFSLISFNASYHQSYYYDAVYLMSASSFRVARQLLLRLLALSPSRFIFLYLLSFSPPLWTFLHSRPVKSFVTGLIAFASFRFLLYSLRQGR